MHTHTHEFFSAIVSVHRCRSISWLQWVYDEWSCFYILTISPAAVRSHVSSLYLTVTTFPHPLCLQNHCRDAKQIQWQLTQGFLFLFPSLYLRVIFPALSTDIFLFSCMDSRNLTYLFKVIKPNKYLLLFDHDISI